MAATPPVRFDVPRLRAQIRATYDRLARELAELAKATRLRGCAIHGRFDRFRDTAAEERLSTELRIHAVSLFAQN